MKKITALLSLLMIWAVSLNINITAFAQKGEAGGGGGKGFAATPVATIPSPIQSGFKLRVSAGEPLASTQTPLGTINSAVNVSVEGVTGGGPVYGFVAELRGDTENIEKIMLLNGDEIWGSPKRANYQTTLGREFYVNKGARWNFTVAVQTRSSLSSQQKEGPESQPRRFSVAIAAIITDAEVEGSLAVGPQHVINTTLQIGRVKAKLTPMAEQNLLPYLNQQWLLTTEFSADSVEEQAFPWLAYDIYASGGRVSDANLVLVDASGTQLGWPQYIEESEDDLGKGTAYFHWPFRLGKSGKNQIFLGARLGQSWVDGGTVSAAFVPSKSVAIGGTYGFKTSLAPHAVFGGPVMTVKPIAKYEVKPLPIDAPLREGRNDLIRFSVTVPPNVDVVIPGYGVRIGWLPEGDDYNEVMLYGYTDSTFSKPLPGLQPDGAFTPENRNIAGYQQFSGFDIPVIRAGGVQQPSGIYLSGQTAYFVARANFKPSGPFSVVGTVIADPATWKTLQFQIRSK